MNYITKPRWMPVLFGISLSLLAFVGCSQQSPVNSQFSKVEDQVDPREKGLTVSPSPVEKEGDEVAVNDKPSGRDPRGNNAKSTALLKEWPTPGLAIVLTGRQHGYLEPCGCTGLQYQKGGLARRQELVRQLKEDHKWPLLLVDARFSHACESDHIWAADLDSEIDPLFQSCGTVVVVVAVDDVTPLVSAFEILHLPT